MEPTLLQGDFIFVKKYSYGLRLPVTETKVVETGSPERGDVIVFRKPSEPNINFIKRVVGLPGDEIVYSNHRLSVNGQTVPLTPAVTIGQPLPSIHDELLDDRLHKIQVLDPHARGEATYTVPDGHYFVMGDNRDNSHDSRFLGTIPEEFLVGEAVRIWLHMDGIGWPDWERMGTKIQ